MKKKRQECEVHPTNLWDSLTPAQRKKLKPRIVDAKLFVLPCLKVEGLAETPHVWPPENEQKRLEEAALLARWCRKHKPASYKSG